MLKYSAEAKVPRNPVFEAQFKPFRLSDYVNQSTSRQEIIIDEHVCEIKPFPPPDNLSNTSVVLPACYDRSKWKAIYLRDRRIYNNWRRRRITAACELRGHDEHVITCMQTVGDLIVTGSDDHTLRVWQCSTAQVSFFFFLI